MRHHEFDTELIKSRILLHGIYQLKYETAENIIHVYKIRCVYFILTDSFKSRHQKQTKI